MGKEAIVAEPPEQKMTFHTTAPARMSGHMESHRHRLVNYIHPHEDRSWIRHRETPETRQEAGTLAARVISRKDTTKGRPPPPPSSSRRLQHHPHYHHHHHHDHHLPFLYCNIKNPRGVTCVLHV